MIVELSDLSPVRNRTAHVPGCRRSKHPERREDVDRLPFIGAHVSYIPCWFCRPDQEIFSETLDRP